MSQRIEKQQDQCQFYLERKKRLCRFRPRPGDQYCPEHACVLGIQSERKRIPCPLNPKHNCYEDDLQNHLKKCPVTKSLEATAKLQCYVKDLNQGHGDDGEAKASAEKQKSVNELKDKTLGEIIARVNKLYKDCVDDIEVLHLEHVAVREHIAGDSTSSLENAFKDQVILKKELLQQASLVGQLDHLGFLSHDHCFVELGAGRGKLSHWIQMASKSCSGNKFILVDRSSVRYKMDSFHKGDGMEGTFQRIKIDIKDLCLGKVPEVNGKTPVIVIGKHLCGGATDMGIRCAVDTLRLKADDKTIKSEEKDRLKSAGADFIVRDNAITQEDKNKIVQADKVSNKTPDVNQIEEERLKSGGTESPPAKVSRQEEKANHQHVPQGIMIALCCHHQCTWNTYVGRGFMRELGISPEEFDILTRLSSWATCARVRVRSQKNVETPDAKVIKDEKGKDMKKEEIGGKQTKTVRDVPDEDDHSVEDLIGASLEGGESLREKLSVSQREEIGRRCKRIIDMGRIHYLRSKGMSCLLREYVDELQTPENVVLIATSSDGHKS